MKRLLIIPLLFGALVVPSPALAVLPPNDPGGSQSQECPAGTDPVTCKEVKKTSVVDYIDDIYTFAGIVGGLIAMLMLIYAGYRYMTSYGDPEKISDAKDILEKTLLGLTLLILAAVLLRTINPRTVEPCVPGQAGCGNIDFSKPKG